MIVRAINALHCKQSVYNLRQITEIAEENHDPLTRKWLADKVYARHIFADFTTEAQAKAVNHALTKLGDNRRVKV